MTEAIPYHSNESREAIQNPPSEGKRLAIDMRVPSDEAVEKAGASASPELLALNERQRQEKQELYNRYASERESILSTTHEEKQELVTDKARRSLYDTLWIDENFANNSGMKQFLKGLVDGAIVWNIELAESVAKDPGKATEAISHLASIEWLKEALHVIGKTFKDLASGDPYEVWKSLAEIGLVASGITLVAGVVKTTVKHTIRHETKTMLEIGTEHTARWPIQADTYAYPKYLIEEVEPRKVWMCAKEEMEKISDSASNLQFFSWILQHEPRESMRLEIQKIGNDWLDSRLKNIQLFLDYTDKLPANPTKVRMRENDITQFWMRRLLEVRWFRKIIEQLEEAKIWWFRVSEDNKGIIKNIKDRLQKPIS